MKAGLGVVLVALALTACAGAEVAPGVVGKAVAEAPCTANVPPRPTFPIDALTGDEDVWTIGKALWADYKARKAYQLQLETIVEGCTRASAP